MVLSSLSQVVNPGSYPSVAVILTILSMVLSSLSRVVVSMGSWGAKDCITPTPVKFREVGHVDRR